VFAKLADKVTVRLQADIKSVAAQPNGSLIVDDGEQKEFDFVIMACSADAAVRLQKAGGLLPTLAEKLLARIGYVDDDDHSFTEGM
jgi:predicted NAD/FAD-binding protein